MNEQLTINQINTSHKLILAIKDQVNENVKKQYDLETVNRNLTAFVTTLADELAKNCTHYYHSSCVILFEVHDGYKNCISCAACFTKIDVEWKKVQDKPYWDNYSQCVPCNPISGIPYPEFKSDY